MVTTRRTALLFLLLLMIPTSAAEIDDSIFDVLDMEFFNGNWSILEDVANDGCVCEYPGTLYIITQISTSRGKRRGEPRHRIYVAEYRNCVFKEHDEYGSILCRGDGCWISTMGRNFMVYDDILNRRSDEEKAILNNTSRFGGVCSRDWHPFYGDPAVESTVRNHKHIWGDPKIRFENVSIINGKMYIEKDSAMIIDANVWHSVDEIDSYKTCKKCDRWVSCFDSVNTTMTNTISDGIVTVNVDATLKWYYYRRSCHISGDDIVCYDHFRNTTETARFTTTAAMPNVIDVPQVNCTAYITHYNYSRSPVAFIDVETPEPVIKITFTYNNTSIVKHNSVGWLHDTYIEFANNSIIWQADSNQTVMSRRGDSAVVVDRNFTASNLTITLNTPYSQHNVTNFTLTVVEQEKPRVGLLVKLLAVLAASAAAIVMVVGVLRRSF